MIKKNKVQDRQQAIHELITSEPIADQGQLVSFLFEKKGIETNQAVVSRDLRKMGVVKKGIHGKMIYEMPSSDTQTEILKLAVTDVSHNEMMIVIHTQPGLAAFVADYIDHYTNLDVLGSLAGENAVFICPKTVKNIKKIYLLLCHKIHFKK